MVIQCERYYIYHIVKRKYISFIILDSHNSRHIIHCGDNSRKVMLD